MSTNAPAPGTTEELAAATMRSLVWSLADNKAALGRRYAEWAVSAPTLESAVAAAAMAQDELGHSRSTYPVLKTLGAEVTQDAPFGGDRHLALLDCELEDWTAAVAANLLVDGVLTTFVASCADSSITPMAQRARKILQEEGSHRIHAEAWARRLCRSGDQQRELLTVRLRTTWAQAGRWLGPAGDSGVQAAVSSGMIASDARAQRALMRNWLCELLASEGVVIELDEPDDFSRWDAERRRWNLTG
jgi:ring-1,2-phenylacetyl-CoA epoxidase subunit PaaC